METLFTNTDFEAFRELSGRKKFEMLVSQDANKKDGVKGWKTTYENGYFFRPLNGTDSFYIKKEIFEASRFHQRRA